MIRTEFIKGWVEIIAIVCAGFWAFYTFIYSEYIKTTRFFDAAIEMKGDYDVSDELIYVQIRIKLSNPSSRRLYIKAAYFELHGDTIKSAPESRFSSEIYEKVLNNGDYTANGYKLFTSELVGGGAFLTNAWADPKESITVNRVVYVPQNRFSQLECNLYIQSVLNPNLIDVRKKVDKNFSVVWEVKKTGDNENVWLSEEDKTGYKLLDDHSTLIKTNAFLPLKVNTTATKKIRRFFGNNSHWLWMVIVALISIWIWKRKKHN